MEMEQQKIEQGETRKRSNFGSKMGSLIGCVFTACIATCLCAIMISSTISFINWLF